MYTTGIIKEDSFNLYSIPEDCNLEGDIVTKTHGISQENRQRAKILSSPCQIEERKKLIYEKQMVSYQKKKNLYDAESNKYDMNQRCMSKLFDIMAEYKVKKGILNEQQIPSMSFDTMCHDITFDIVNINKKFILSAEAKSFIKVRSVVALTRGRLTYKNVPDLKEDVLRRLVEMISYLVKGRYFVTEPSKPTLEARTFDSLLETGVADEDCVMVEM